MQWGSVRAVWKCFRECCPSEFLLHPWEPHLRHSHMSEGATGSPSLIRLSFRHSEHIDQMLWATALFTWCTSTAWLTCWQVKPAISSEESSSCGLLGLLLLFVFSGLALDGSFTRICYLLTSWNASTSLPPLNPCGQHGRGHHMEQDRSSPVPEPALSRSSGTCGEGRASNLR